MSALMVAMSTSAPASADPVEDARAKLNPAARAKMPAEALERLLRQGSPEVVIEFSARPATMFVVGGVGVGSPQRAAQIQLLADEIKGARDTVRARHGRRFTTLKEYSHLPYVHARVANPVALAELLNDGAIVTVHPILWAEPNLGSSLPYIGQTHVVATSGLSGHDRAVAILDTGVDFTNPAFGTCTAAANGWQPQPSANCRVVASLDFGDSDGFADDDGHGTNVAAIAASVAREADIVMLDVFSWNDADSDGVRDSGEVTTSSASILAALNWIVANQATNGIVAANMSLGGNRDVDNDGAGDGDGDLIGDTGFVAANCPTTINAALGNVRAVGVVPTASSGNDGFGNGGVDNGISWPACDAGTIAVGASYDGDLGWSPTFDTVNVVLTQGLGIGTCTDTAPQARDVVTCFSNSSALVDIIAPGGSITAGGFTMFGTSQAAPHVAGSLALLAQASNLPNSPNGTDAGNLQQDLLTTTAMARDPKWSNNLMPRLNLSESIREASVWRAIVQALPGSAWYTQAARARLEFEVIGLAHLRFQENTSSYDSATLDRAMRAPLVHAALP